MGLELATESLYAMNEIETIFDYYEGCKLVKRVEEIESYLRCANVAFQRPTLLFYICNTRFYGAVRQQII